MGLDFIDGLGDFHATSFTPPAGMDLGLDHPDGPA